MAENNYVFLNNRAMCIFNLPQNTSSSTGMWGNLSLIKVVHNMHFIFYVTHEKNNLLIPAIQAIISNLFRWKQQEVNPEKQYKSWKKQDDWALWGGDNLLPAELNTWTCTAFSNCNLQRVVFRDTDRKGIPSWHCQKDKLDLSVALID